MLCEDCEIVLHQVVALSPDEMRHSEAKEVKIFHLSLACLLASESADVL